MFKFTWRNFLWDTIKWWQVYCLRNQINVVWILAVPHGAEEGGNMAGAKTARAEVRLVSNIFVCVSVCVRWAVGIVLQVSCVKFGTSKYFFCFFYFLNNIHGFLPCKMFFSPSVFNTQEFVMLPAQQTFLNYTFLWVIAHQSLIPFFSWALLN